MKLFSLIVLAMFLFPVNTNNPAALTFSNSHVTLDASDCWDRCDKCRDRCSNKSGDDKRNCEENCFDANASCCESCGKKGTAHSCGCW